LPWEILIWFYLISDYLTVQDYLIKSKVDADLMVSDDGVGLPYGLDIDTTTSPGLRLVKLLTEDKLQGKLDIIRNKILANARIFLTEALERAED
jgi:two-component sensor histidine kinase